jgi:O-antigen/teichoic acid export membrane protein
MIRSIDTIIPQVLTAKGKADMVLKYSTVLFVTLPVAFYIGCYVGGIEGVAVAWIIAYPVLVLILFYFGFKSLCIHPFVYMKNLEPQFKGTLIMSISIFAISSLSRRVLPESYLTNLIISSIVGILVYFLYFYWWNRSELLEIWNTLKDLKAQQRHVEVQDVSV